MTSFSKVLVADDHVLIRDGLKHRLAQHDQSIVVVEAKDGKEVLRLVEQNSDISVILLDLYMPKTEGYNLLVTLCDNYPDIPVIVLSSTEEHAVMRRVLDIGVSGFIPKSTSHEVTISAIQLVLSGGVYIPATMLREEPQIDSESPLEQDLLPSVDNNFESNKKNISRELTGRQKDVFLLLIKGLQNKEIANKLGLSEHTIKIHVTAIFKVLKVSNRIQAVLAVHGLNE